MKRRSSERFRSPAALMEKYGVMILAAVCVAAIIFSAVWRSRMNFPAPSAAPDAMSRPASQLMQETLPPGPTGTPERVSWLSPVSDAVVLAPFDASRMRRGSVCGLYSVHDAVDLAAPCGSNVLAMADGVVVSAVERSVRGAYLVIDHGSDVTAAYCGLQSPLRLLAGSSVRRGQIIGQIGESAADEGELPAHLHLRVTRARQAIDPCLLFDTMQAQSR